MDAKVDINFDSREKKWSGSGDTRAPVVPVAPVAAEAPVPPATKAMAGAAQSAAPVTGVQDKGKGPAIEVIEISDSDDDNTGSPLKKARTGDV